MIPILLTYIRNIIYEPTLKFHSTGKRCDSLVVGSTGQKKDDKCPIE